VLVIVDGLGDNYVRAQDPLGALARHRRGAIRSVFPSTTASAITTSFTGATPYEHGLTGWFTYFGAAGCVAARCRFARAATTCRSRARHLRLGSVQRIVAVRFDRRARHRRHPPLDRRTRSTTSTIAGARSVTRTPTCRASSSRPRPR
jgi:hypothetical protein